MEIKADPGCFGNAAERRPIAPTGLGRARLGLFVRCRGFGPSRQSVDGRRMEAVVEPAQAVDVYSNPNTGQEQHDDLIKMAMHNPITRWTV